MVLCKNKIALTTRYSAGMERGENSYTWYKENFVMLIYYLG